MSLMIKPGKSHIVTLVISYYSHSSVPLNVGGDQLKGMTNRRPFIREIFKVGYHRYCSGFVLYLIKLELCSPEFPSQYSFVLVTAQRENCMGIGRVK